MSIGFEQWVTASVLEHVFGFTPGMLEKVRREARKGKVRRRPSNYCRTDMTYHLGDCYAVFTGTKVRSRKVE